MDSLHWRHEAQPDPVTQTIHPPYLPALHTPPPGVTLPREEWYSDEPPLETDRHREQINHLINEIKWWWRHRRDFYASGNLTIYYNPDQKTNQDFRGPDFFVILNTDPRERRSWMIWNENYAYPNLIIELLSPTTAHVDRTTKKELYQDQFQTPEYFWFDPNLPEDPNTLQEFEGFRLIDGEYQPILRTERGWMWSEQLELYLGVYDNRLRFFTAAGELVPTAAEAKEQEAEQQRQRADHAEQRADHAEQRAEQQQREKELQQQRADHAEQQNQRLCQQLRALGFEPESCP